MYTCMHEYLYAQLGVPEFHTLMVCNICMYMYMCTEKFSE